MNWFGDLLFGAFEFIGQHYIIIGWGLIAAIVYLSITLFKIVLKEGRNESR
jgi:hypothetical protein